jgi:hypothetical protein
MPGTRFWRLAAFLIVLAGRRQNQSVNYELHADREHSNPQSRAKVRAQLLLDGCGLVRRLLLAQHGDALRFERHHSSQDAGRSADVVEPQSSPIHLSLQPAFDQRVHLHDGRAVKRIGDLREAIAFSDYPASSLRQLRGLARNTPHALAPA